MKLSIPHTHRDSDLSKSSHCCPKLDHWKDRDKEFKKQYKEKRFNKSSNQSTNQNLENRILRLEQILSNILSNNKNLIITIDINSSATDGITYSSESEENKVESYRKTTKQSYSYNNIENMIEDSKREQQEYTLKMIKTIKENLESTIKSNLEVFDFIHDEKEREMNEKLKSLSSTIENNILKLDCFEDRLTKFTKELFNENNTSIKIYTTLNNSINSVTEKERTLIDYDIINAAQPLNQI